jgi:hypothetical protein
MTAYRHLDAGKLQATLAQLQARIGERFPESGLFRVCAELNAVAGETAARAGSLSRPYVLLRAGVAFVLLVGAALQIASGRYFFLNFSDADTISLLQGLEAAVNLLILMAGGAWFLLTLEERLKRRRALDWLHELRSLAHVVDMHQLTKDPTIILGNLHRRTAHSPARPMSEFELTRYLEYCAEMQALTGKLAALYAEEMRDPVVIEAVNDVETLTTNLGRKIWQKITIIGQLVEG